MNYTDEQLQLAAQRTCDQYALILNQKLRISIPVPVPLSFNLQDTKPRWAGSASYMIHVNLNMILYRDNVNSFLNDTIPHEMAHLVQFLIFDHNKVDTQGHGAEWCEVMRKLGKTPKKHHDYDISKSMAHFKSLKKKKRVKDDHPTSFN